EKHAHLDGRIKLLALQTMVGAWPLDLDRLQSTLVKSAREAKLRTRWTRPDEQYEKSLEAFAHDVLESDSLRALIARYVGGIETHARGISLAWTLLKCTC